MHKFSLVFVFYSLLLGTGSVEGVSSQTLWICCHMHPLTGTMVGQGGWSTFRNECPRAFFCGPWTGFVCVHVGVMAALPPLGYEVPLKGGKKR